MSSFPCGMVRMDVRRKHCCKREHSESLQEETGAAGAGGNGRKSHQTCGPPGQNLLTETDKDFFVLAKNERAPKTVIQPHQNTCALTITKLLFTMGLPFNTTWALSCIILV